jgi:hypothetical protein
VKDVSAEAKKRQAAGGDRKSKEAREKSLPVKTPEPQTTDVAP